MKSVVIDMLVDSTAAKGHVVPTSDQLTEEMIMLLSAGNDTTSDALIIGIWQICRHPEVLQQLELELKTAFPSIHNSDAITYEHVKPLPYIVSFKPSFDESRTDSVQECCDKGDTTYQQSVTRTTPTSRSRGGIHSVWRTCPRKGKIFIHAQLFHSLIKPQIAFNFSSHLLNRHPSVWTDPNTFDPDRWLQPDAARLDKYLATFQNGTRQCLGKQ